MEYTKDYYELKSLFLQGASEIKIPGSQVSIVSSRFISDIDPGSFLNNSDHTITENTEFSYPVFVPGDKTSRKTILLMHGLNERSWVKYLVWAYRLCENTGSYVVLFPISFHINRGPTSWIDPRIMQQHVKERTMAEGDISMSTFANVALSKRLTEEPLRFFNSGYQTAMDIIKLFKQIMTGSHSIIPGGSRVNIFAYSIGAFLSQILMMGNHETIFSGSRLFIFCGGSVFSNMHGTSKLIMDSLAYKRIYSFYLDDFEKVITLRKTLNEFFRSSQVGLAFRSMIDLGRFRTFRESVFSKLKDQIRSIALKHDKVIPADGIMNTLTPMIRNAYNPVEVWDFPFSYTHENPFPILAGKSAAEVDRSFERLISAASSFLA
jgi:hypothetical protein